MRSTEFIVEKFSTTIQEVFEELADVYKKDIKVIKKMATVCKKAELQMTMIEPLLRITRDCQPYLHEVGIDNAFNLYRGIRGEGADDIKQPVHLNGRTPRSMDPFLFDEINKYFTEIYGQPFRNAMLATGNEHHSRIFGRTYAVFPMGNFKFLWNEQVDDFNFAYAKFGEKLRENNRIDGSTYSSNNVDLISKLFLEEFIQELDWHTIDMNAATQANAEIMIRCKEYYGINWNKFQDNEPVLIELLRIANA